MVVEQGKGERGEGTDDQVCFPQMSLNIISHKIWPASLENFDFWVYMLEILSFQKV